jgi:hypothetical protein
VRGQRDVGSFGAALGGAGGGPAAIDSAGEMVVVGNRKLPYGTCSETAAPSTITAVPTMTRSFSAGTARGRLGRSTRAAGRNGPAVWIAGALLALSCGARAQEGFPLDGTWRGDRGATSGQSQRVVMIMKWNGHGIEGMINPGPNSVAFESAALDPGTWTVRIEAQARDGTRIVVVGKLDELGSYHRTLAGTWTQGASSHPLRMTRD